MRVNENNQKLFAFSQIIGAKVMFLSKLQDKINMKFEHATNHLNKFSSKFDNFGGGGGGLHSLFGSKGGNGNGQHSLLGSNGGGGNGIHSLFGGSKNGGSGIHSLFGGSKGGGSGIHSLFGGLLGASNGHGNGAGQGELSLDIEDGDSVSTGDNFHADGEPNFVPAPDNGFPHGQELHMGGDNSFQHGSGQESSFGSGASSVDHGNGAHMGYRY